MSGLEFSVEDVEMFCKNQMFRTIFISGLDVIIFEKENKFKAGADFSRQDFNKNPKYFKTPKDFDKYYDLNHNFCNLLYDDHCICDGYWGGLTKDEKDRNNDLFSFYRYHDLNSLLILRKFIQSIVYRTDY
jgi:hypothetical protein